ncbi:MAG: DUF4956 domain-containing protein [Ruminococcaceae bacterium]|nr:DUF4956 domain-containing protein [Oscillospiraceae bacterium]
MLSRLTTFLNNVIAINSLSNIINMLAAIFVAFVLGLIIYFTYKITTQEFSFDRELGLTLIIIPVVVALLLSVIGTNIARAFSLAGALSIIRYRSSIIKPRNIAFIFFGMGAGFITGTGLFIPALLFVLITCAFIVIFTAIGNKKSAPVKKTLVIAIPESINYDGLLDDTLKKYVTAYSLAGVRVTGGGTLTELTYYVKVPSDLNVKAFMDELRVLNGNFKIKLTQYVPTEEL